MGSPFDVLDGDIESKELLIETLHTAGEERTGLKEFIADLEETELRFGSFWIAVDDEDNPRGALTVRYLEEEKMSYLRSIWTRVLKTEDQFTASKLLLDAWMEDQHYEIRRYQADLPLYSPLTESIQRAGFQKEKLLLAYYDLETDWEISELPEGYIMRPVKREELSWVYRNLIYPDLDPESPIFVSEERFLQFSARMSAQAMESWVIVENEQGARVGFASSFLNADPSREEDNKQAVMFGPHSSEAAVQLAIIKEMSTYWKTQGVATLRIVRGNEFYPSVEDELELELINSTVRFVLEK